MTEKSISFVLPRLPPSVNSLYQIIYTQRRVELKPEYRRWKSEMKAYVPAFAVSDGSLLRVDCEFTFNFGRRRFDSANLLKLTLDAICEKLGVNDRIVRHGSWRSLNSVEKEFVTVTITEV